MMELGLEPSLSDFNSGFVSTLMEQSQYIQYIP